MEKTSWLGNKRRKQSRDAKRWGDWELGKERRKLGRVLKPTTKKSPGAESSEVAESLEVETSAGGDSENQNL